VRKHVEVRRDLETAQSNLTVLTGAAAVTGALPFFVGGLFRAPVLVVLGVLILIQSVRIYMLYRRYYRLRGGWRARQSKKATI